MIQIYGLIDPRNKRIRYIGQTSHVDKRYRQHVAHPTASTKDWIEELKVSALQPILIVLEDVNGDSSGDQIEAEWIHFYRQMGGDLLNRRALLISYFTSKTIQMCLLE